MDLHYYYNKEQQHTAKTNVEPTSLDRGYNYDFIETPSDDLLCRICYTVARDPLQHGQGGCGKIFCRSCITNNRRKGDNRCPNCRQAITTFKDDRSERDILSLKVWCTNLSNGCKCVVELRSIEKHLQNCDYAWLECPYMCTTSILRKDLQKHLKVCPRRPHTCSYCMETGEYQDIIGEHTLNCPKIKITCSNFPLCPFLIPREDLQTHLSTNCLYQKVSCKYKEFGCKVTPLRKDLEDHEKDDKLHLSITMTTVLKHQAKIEYLLSYGCGPPHQITFKMSNFAERKKTNAAFYSPPFFTHHRGYKLAICVNANGYAEFYDTHVSVWAFLMRGENDEELEFPFLGSVTFELLNQLEDKNHYKKICKYYRYDNGNQRVTDGDRAATGRGVGGFIRHSALKYKEVKNCCYLKNDCLVFRIYVEVPSYKPWLQCTK